MSETEFTDFRITVEQMANLDRCGREAERQKWAYGIRELNRYRIDSAQGFSGRPWLAWLEEEIDPQGQWVKWEDIVMLTASRGVDDCAVPREI
jgi:hypothetical protein